MKRIKILIVEDDVFSRGAMEKILESYDYETSSCATAEEAVIKLQEESFGILITDLQMGEMDGLELIKEARRIYPQIPSILVTGLASEEIRLKAKEEGVNGFFPKPIEWGELIGLLDVLTKTGRGRNQNSEKNSGKMKYSLLQCGIFIMLVLSLFAIQMSEGQERSPKLDRPNLRINSQGTCWESSSLELTEAQKKELENLQRAYSAEAMPLRRELISLRFELRYLILDPTVQAKILLDRQKKISELQGKLENLSLSYQIKARSIFTKEQWEQLPQDCSLGMEVGFGMGTGISRGPRKGLH